MKSEKQLSESLTIDYGVLNGQEIIEADKFIESIKNNLPNLYKQIDILVEEAKAIHGPITLRFSHGNDAIEHKNKVIFGASFSPLNKTINLDVTTANVYTSIQNFIFELCNACNKELSDYLEYIYNQPYNPYLNQTQIDETALNIEKKEFLSLTRTKKIFDDYLKNNEKEITKIVSEQEYQEKLKECTLNITLENSIELFKEHTEFYKIIVSYSNEIKRNPDGIKHDSLNKKYQAQLEKLQDDLKNSAAINQKRLEKNHIELKQKRILTEKLSNNLFDKYQLISTKNLEEYSKKTNENFDKAIENKQEYDNLPLLEQIKLIMMRNQEVLDNSIKYLKDHTQNLSLEQLINVSGECKTYIDNLEFEQL